MPAETDILLITVTTKETNALLAEFRKRIGKEPEFRQMGDRSYLELGELNNQRIWHMRCQMGSISVGSSLQDITKAVISLQPRAVIMVGIAMGANIKAQQIGDVLISRKLVLYEPARIGADKIIRGDRASCSGFLLSRFQGASVLWRPDRPVNVDAGLILTGEKLVDDPDFRASLLQHEPEAIGVEMEGAGLYTACVDAGIPWIMVKGICDWGMDKDKDKEPNQIMAAKNAAEFAAHALGMTPPLFVPAEKVEGPVIAHLYWLGSDLADGIRHVQEGLPLLTLKHLVSQATRHFRKSGFKSQSIQDGLAHLGNWVEQQQVARWPSDQALRRSAFDAFVQLKGQVNIFINTKAGPDFDPDNG